MYVNLEADHTVSRIVGYCLIILPVCFGCTDRIRFNHTTTEADTMDIPEWMSGTSPFVWKALRFSTLTICVLGILGNVSSVVVLGRHLSEIPGSGYCG